MKGKRRRVAASTAPGEWQVRLLPAAERSAPSSASSRSIDRSSSSNGGAAVDASSHHHTTTPPVAPKAASGATHGDGDGRARAKGKHNRECSVATAAGSHVNAPMFQDELAAMRRRSAPRRSGSTGTSRGGRRSATSAKGHAAATLEASTVDELFFELANAPAVAYRCPNGAVVTVEQVPDVDDCTGGVVWETSFALAAHLTEGSGRGDVAAVGAPGARPAVVELGAGCGLLGAVLAQCGCDVLVTEVDQAMPHLSRNAAANAPRTPGWLRPARLLWGDDADIAAALRQSRGGGGFDAVVATDIIFSAALVEPLLRTTNALVAPGGSVHVCVQVRCADAHAAFVRDAPSYFADVDALAEQLAEHGATAFAAECDCLIFRLGRRREVAPLVARRSPPDEQGTGAL